MRCRAEGCAWVRDGSRVCVLPVCPLGKRPVLRRDGRTLVPLGASPCGACMRRRGSLVCESGEGMCKSWKTWFRRRWRALRRDGEGADK